MNRESLKKLKLDRRLVRRRGWIAKDELAREIDALPDVSDKVAPPDEEPGETTAPEKAPEP